MKTFNKKLEQISKDNPLHFQGAMDYARYSIISNKDEDWDYYEQKTGNSRPFKLNKKGEPLISTGNVDISLHQKYMLWCVEEFIKGATQK
jgi:hypothetical protein